MLKYQREKLTAENLILLNFPIHEPCPHPLFVKLITITKYIFENLKSTKI